MFLPVVGEMWLMFEKLAVNGSSEQLLVVYRARPQTTCEAALAQLVPVDIAAADDQEAASEG